MSGEFIISPTVWRFQFLPILASAYFLLFWEKHLNDCAVVSHCGFVFPWWLMKLNVVSCVHWVIFLSESLSNAESTKVGTRRSWANHSHDLVQSGHFIWLVRLIDYQVLYGMLLLLDLFPSTLYSCYKCDFFPQLKF